MAYDAKVSSFLVNYGGQRCGIVEFSRALLWPATQKYRVFSLIMVVKGAEMSSFLVLYRVPERKCVEFYRFSCVLGDPVRPSKVPLLLPEPKVAR